MGKFIKLKENDGWRLQIFSDQGKRYLKVPIAVLGQWQHPEYSFVEFSQKDFNEILQNWSENVAGYEPPLFLGHPNNDKAIEGAPSVGFLEKLYQEDNKLFGLFDPVDDEVFSDVEKGAYRYSSAEVYRNAYSKTTGKPVGTLLRGVALTNRPFLTGMPRVETIHQQFSEQPLDNVSFLFPLTTETMTTEQITSEIAPATTTPTSNDQFQKLSEKVVDLTLIVEGLQSKLTATEQKLSETSALLEKQEQATLLAKLNTLNVNADTKQMFSEMITDGSLSGAALAAKFEKLEELSKANAQTFSEPKGSVIPQPSEEEIVNPYQKIIEKNAQILSERNRQVQAQRFV